MRGHVIKPSLCSDFYLVTLLPGDAGVGGCMGSTRLLDVDFMLSDAPFAWTAGHTQQCHEQEMTLLGGFLAPFRL